MPALHLQRLVGNLHRAIASRELDGLSDADLLDRFRSGHDSAAFEAIVRRHGARALAAARQVLSEPADADDVFQATFLVLLTQAKNIRKGRSLDCWLIGVAHRLALQMRRHAARRRTTLGRTNARAADEPPDLSWREACAILHQELDRLPDVYRLPLLLCYIEGRTRDDAARQLGVTAETVRGRLERGRNKLRGRLTRRGVTLSAGLLAAVTGSSSAALPSAQIVQSTFEAAASGCASTNVGALIHGAVCSMLIGKLKSFAAVAVMMAGLIATGAYLSTSAPAMPGEKNDHGQPSTNEGPASAQKDPKDVPTPTVAANVRPLAEQVKAAIDKGVKYLETRQENRGGQWNWENSELLNQAWSGGTTCLATLALLTAGKKADDPTLQKTLPYIRALKTTQTYVVALRTMVLAEIGETKDRQIIQGDVDLLLGNAIRANGDLKGWSYGTVAAVEADNSNTQYAVLGLFAGRKAGAKIDSKVWQEIQKLFIKTQTNDGGWTYRAQPADKPTHSMTCAGLTALFISCAEQGSDKQQFDAKTGIAKKCGVYEQDKAAAGGMDWLANHFSFETGDSTRATFYNIYGIERVGRLSGQRLIGEHDWYREGCELLCGLKPSGLNQKDNGSWRMDAGIDDMPVLSTSFALLFLARGRTPILISKLAFDGDDNNKHDWNHKHHDARNLVDFASKALFKNQPLAWQVFDPRSVNLGSDEAFKAQLDSMRRSPILYMTGHAAPNLSDRQVELLRRYVDSGGFILAEACCGSQEFDKGFRKLMAKVFAGASPLAPLPPDNPIWTAHARLDSAEFNRGLDKDHAIQYVQRKSRVVVIYSPEPLAGYWEDRRFMPDRAAPNIGGPRSRGELAYRFAENVISYATGLKTPGPRP